MDTTLPPIGHAVARPNEFCCVRLFWHAQLFRSFFFIALAVKSTAPCFYAFQKIEFFHFLCTASVRNMFGGAFSGPQHDWGIGIASAGLPASPVRTGVAVDDSLREICAAVPDLIDTVDNVADAVSQLKKDVAHLQKGTNLHCAAGIKTLQSLDRLETLAQAQDNTDPPATKKQVSGLFKKLRELDDGQDAIFDHITTEVEVPLQRVQQNVTALACQLDDVQRDLRLKIEATTARVDHVGTQLGALHGKLDSLLLLTATLVNVRQSPGANVEFENGPEPITARAVVPLADVEANMMADIATNTTAPRFSHVAFLDNDHDDSSSSNNNIGAGEESDSDSELGALSTIADPGTIAPHAAEAEHEMSPTSIVFVPGPRAPGANTAGTASDAV
jgi:hypothetical protein